ncbi:hypothetical protein ACRALDRAFT_1076905 [Sodiomyces alcalophilus JCM 7366]|uniref:uncharacterized protein n=1 Tax=Sodiomyces alcalophilus JCM 7366 TaxID=591952 RepID=UPI0039B3C3D5
MVREGTRSQTGNSRPRIFPVVESAPATVRKRAPKTKKSTEEAVPKASKPTGVTKTKAKVTKAPKQTKTKANTATVRKGAAKATTKNKVAATSVDN